MGSQSEESFEEFLESLKQAGIAITNESELRERLSEVQFWRYAFMTLVANGRSIGIRFEERDAACDREQIGPVLERYRFPKGSDAILAASLQAPN